MDLIDLIWNTTQSDRINSVTDQVERMRGEHERLSWDLPKLAVENMELKLRLGLLVRLLIDKGVITAGDYAALIADSQPKLEK